jgi:hypothetical protein
MSKAHMQVHTNKESRGKQLGRKPGPNWAETGLGRPAWADWPSPFRARFDASFDLTAILTIYSPLAKSHEKIDSSSATTRPRTRSRLDRKGSTHGFHLLRGDSTPWSSLQWVTLWGKVLVCPRGWRGILSCNHRTYVSILLLSYSCWWCFNLIGRPTCFGGASLVASLSCSFCSLCDYRRVVTVRGRENIINLVHTFDHACLEHINIFCT